MKFREDDSNARFMTADIVVQVRKPYTDIRKDIGIFYARGVVTLVIVIMNAMYAVTEDALKNHCISTLKQNHILSASSGVAASNMALFKSLMSTSENNTLMNAKNVRGYFKAMRLLVNTVAPDTSTDHHKLTYL